MNNYKKGKNLVLKLIKDLQILDLSLGISDCRVHQLYIYEEFGIALIKGKLISELDPYLNDYKILSDIE